MELHLGKFQTPHCRLTEELLFVNGLLVSRDSRATPKCLCSSPCRPLTQSPPWVQVFELNPVRAWGAVITSLVSMAACLYAISVSPWYLLPFAWALSGTAFTGVSACQPPARHPGHMPPGWYPTEWRWEA